MLKNQYFYSHTERVLLPRQNKVPKRMYRGILCRVEALDSAEIVMRPRGCEREPAGPRVAPQQQSPGTEPCVPAAEQLQYNRLADPIVQKWVHSWRQSKSPGGGPHIYMNGKRTKRAAVRGFTWQKYSWSRFEFALRSRNTFKTFQC